MSDIVSTGRIFNFVKLPESYIDSLNVTYDFQSIMHFSPFEESSNGFPTMTLKNGSLFQTQVSDKTANVRLWKSNA